MTPTCPYGSASWTMANAYYSAAAVDSKGDVYAGGIAPSPSGTFGAPFVHKFGTNGNSLWSDAANASTAVCPTLGSSLAANCVSYPPVQGVSMGFDGGDNVVMASFGNPAIGGGINFGPIGTFPTFPTYGAPNIFLSAYEPTTGSVQWAKHIQTILSGSLHGMALGNQGQIVVAGNYAGSMQVDGQLLITASPQSPSVVDSFLASFAEPDPVIPLIGQGSTCGGPPFNTIPSNIWVPATSPAGACVFFMPPTSSWASTVTCSHPPNTTFPIGSTSVTCTAWDAYGHSATTDPFTVNVFDPPPPVFANVPAPISRIVTGPTVISYTAPTVIDQLDNPTSCSSCAAPLSSGGPPGPPPPCVPPPPVSATCTPASGTTFPVGSTTVFCTTSDPAGRTATTTFTVALVPEVTASCVGTPESPLALQTAPGTCGVDASNTSARAGTCGGALLQLCTFDGQASETLGPGNHAISVLGTAVDLTTTASCTSYVRVVDANAPALTVPGKITTIGNTASGAAVSYSTSATDLCDGALVPICSPASGSTLPVRTNDGEMQGDRCPGQRYRWIVPGAGQLQLVGDLQRINTDGSSIFKLGSTVPVKFELTGASAGITNAVATLLVAKIASSVTGTYAEAVSTSAATSGSAFRYDSSSGQYIFNLSTKGLSIGTWSLSIKLADGVARTVNISLR